MFLSILALTSILALASAKTINIAVGQNATLKFVPDSVTADPGDMLVFRFYNGSAGMVGHSVVSGPFDSPCKPSTGAFFSGYIPGNNVGNDTFMVRVNDTNPIWYYCSYRMHCEAGMVGVVNPPSGMTVQDYANMAKNVSMATAPAAPEGGVLSTIMPVGGAVATSTESVRSGGAMPSTTAAGSSSKTTMASGSSSPSSTAKSGAGKKGEFSGLVGMGAVLGGIAAMMV